MMSDLFPSTSPSYILAFQFSSWYPTFAKHSIKSTIITPLPNDFREYLNAEGIFVPEGSEEAPPQSTLSDDEDNVDSEDDSDREEDIRRKHYAFPELDERIRQSLKEYEAVFPKLNFSSPKDAAWLLPPSSPLKCTSPADVYMLLKSSDFINHDLSIESVFEDYADLQLTNEKVTAPKYELELVLRKWYSVDRGRELRCFVRDNKLIAMTQRDTNFYEFWNELATQQKVVAAVLDFWETNIKPKWTAQPDYTFDFLLTRDLSRGHIIDFNPYAPKTDPLLFTYEELGKLRESSLPDQPAVLRVIDSASHPAANANTPLHQHNMIPFEAVKMSSGRDIEEFSNMWEESIKESTQHDS
ncbi:D123-domain-containing protein [Gymnopilus junonius]|uniref:D123-domain-containing protein n=1 Tax=Gymnopilus junonius TaxID=109634 RepID=A0A9P5NZ60_GYMJU|nr:D123-domain-containing protein [Gymnopilus junonius]